MSSPRPVEVETSAFRAVIPWAFAAPVPHLLAVMAQRDPIQQFAMTLDLLTDLLPDNKVEAFQDLDIHEAAEVVSKWLEASNRERDELDKWQTQTSTKN
jgi:hypothetical protein